MTMKESSNVICMWVNCWICYLFFNMGNMESKLKFRMFSWVPDGTYDHAPHLVRYVIVDGNPVTTISKLWIDQGGPNDLDQYYNQPWNTFLDFPSKPKLEKSVDIN